jgi:thiamine biosynthesis lipoprotein
VLAAEVVAQVDRAMSPWNPASELARFNAHDGTDPVTVSGALAHVAGAALESARETAGAFDPTVGPIVGLHGFGPIRTGADPDWRGVSVEPGTLAKARASLTLDLCAIAKGYAIDAIGERLNEAGIHDWLVDLGGELRAQGGHPSGRPWRAAVARPLATDGEALAAVRLGGSAVATSGVAEHSYVAGGQRASHLVDPYTKRPIRNRILSVSVLADTAMRADALATALAVMGPERGSAFARTRRIDAMFVTGAVGDETIIFTGHFPAHVIG